jgi:hypothetical protein
VRYKLDEPCHVNIEIAYKDDNSPEEPIRLLLKNIYIFDEKNKKNRGTPFTAGFSAKAPAKNNEFTGPNSLHYITDTLKEISEFVEETKENIDIRNKKINENVNDLILVLDNLIKCKKNEQK